MLYLELHNLRVADLMADAERDRIYRAARAARRRDKAEGRHRRPAGRLRARIVG